MLKEFSCKCRGLGLGPSAARGVDLYREGEPMKGGLLVSLLALTVMGGCSLEPDTEIRLGIPYRAQEQFDYCVPACVQMWRAYDRLPAVSQDFIWNWLGGFPGCANGVTAADAVAHFTHAFDAFPDIEHPSGYKNIIARQITSIDQGTPVMAVINEDHTVMVEGGKWHPDGPNYMWDFVVYHDPSPVTGGRALRRGAGDWLQLFCDPGNPELCLQIISASAARTWQTNFINYSAAVSLYSVGDPDNDN